MPIYAYKCSSCGMSKDILRKISDPALTLCPECGKDALEKQVTAAGFQLKGSGWYVTDFREGAKATVVPPVSGDKSSSATTATTETSPAASETKASATAPSVSAPAASTVAPGAST